MYLPKSRYSDDDVSMFPSPFVCGPPPPRHPLIDHPLVVPDGGQAADGVEPVTVSIASPRHIDQPVTWVSNNTDTRVTSHLEAEQSEQLPGEAVVLI